MDVKLAIVSDTALVMGGAERLLVAVSEAFPNAPIYTILYDARRGPKVIESRVVESFLARIPFSRRFAKALLPLFPLAVESFDLSRYDVILSLNHTMAKGVLRTADQLHVGYCHTPMRALWEQTHSEICGMPALVRPFLRMLFLNLRIWDFTAAAKVDKFIANSRVTARRIGVHYRRESVVLTPPIDVDHFTPGGAHEDFYLIASRNVPYKKVDLAIAAMEALGRKLVVVGEGTQRLKTTSPHIRILGKIDESRLVGLMRGARAFIAPQLEDFGMAMLEANACGTPVIAFNRGGAAETQIDGLTGVLFDEQTVPSLAGAVERFESLRFDDAKIRAHAQKFSKREFIKNLRSIVSEAYAETKLSRIEGLHGAECRIS